MYKYPELAVAMLVLVGLNDLLGDFALFRGVSMLPVPGDFGFVMR